jgi:hypothetical protein
MSRLHVKPRIPGAIIRDPHTKRALPDEGGRVPDTTFWRRRLDQGDVVLVVKVDQGDIDALDNASAAFNKHSHVTGPGPRAPLPAMKGE